MPAHLVAYRTSIATGTTAQRVDAITDGVIPIRGGIAFARLVPSTDFFLVAAAAVGGSVTSVRVYTDSMRPVGYDYIRPINRGGGTLFSDNPKLQTLFDTPLRLRGSEEIRVEATQNSGADQVVHCLLWLADGLEPFPAGVEARWIRYTDGTTVTANQWTRLSALTFEQSLATGRYAVLGLEHFSTNGQAARLIFENQSARPGVMALSGSNVGLNRNHAAFYDGSFGVLGYFHSSSLPLIEVLCDAADASAEGYLRIAKIG
jgi:hypothetical protein